MAEWLEALVYGARGGGPKSALGQSAAENILAKGKG